jgi:hypothetical protein
MDMRLVYHRGRRPAEPTTITYHIRPRCRFSKFALEGAVALLGFASETTTLCSSLAETTLGFTCDAVGENRTHHDARSGGNHEANTALVRGRAAGVDRAGSVDGAVSTGETTETAFGARDADKEAAWILVHGRSNRNRSSTGSDAVRGAPATAGTGSGVDEHPTREEDDVADGASEKDSTKAIVGHDRRRRRRGGRRHRGKGTRGNPRPARAALTSGAKTPSGMLSVREESAPARRPDPKQRLSTVELGKDSETYGHTLHGAGPEHDATEAFAAEAFSRQPGTAAGPASPPRTAHGERKGADHRTCNTSRDDDGGTCSGRLWQAREDPVQGLRPRPKNKGTRVEVRAEKLAAAGGTGDDGVAFTGGFCFVTPSRGHGSVGKGVGHVLVFVAVVLGCAALLCCTSLFGKHAGTHAGTLAGMHAGTVKECVSMVASPHAVRSLKGVKKGGESSGESAPHICSG